MGNSPKGVSVGVSGDKKLMAAIAALRKRGADTGPIMKLIGAKMLGFQIEHFDTQSDPEGHPWAPLSPRTIWGRMHKAKAGAWKQIVSGGSKLNQAGAFFDHRSVSGTFGSISGAIRGADREFIAEALATASGFPILQDSGELKGSVQNSLKTSNNEAVVGTSNFKAKTHQYGDKKRNIPQRRFIGLNAAQKTELVGMLGKEAIGKALIEASGDK